MKKKLKKEKNCSQTLSHMKKTWLEAGCSRQKALACCFQVSNMTLHPLLEIRSGWNEPFVMAPANPRAEPAVMINPRDQLSRNKQQLRSCLWGGLCMSRIWVLCWCEESCSPDTCSSQQEITLWLHSLSLKLKQNSSYMQAFIKMCLG